MNVDTLIRIAEIYGVAANQLIYVADFLIFCHFMDYTIHDVYFDFQPIVQILRSLRLGNASISVGISERAARRVAGKIIGRAIGTFPRAITQDITDFYRSVTN